MSATPERSPERDAALAALLAQSPFPGWSPAALGAVLKAEGGFAEDAALLFPDGAAGMLEAFADLIDREMVARAEAAGLETMRVSARVRALIVARLAVLAPHKEAARRALAVLALPVNARVAARCAARTADTTWHAAGDKAVDFSWYTKRAILAGVITATLLYWLQDASEDDVATLGFLDRRLAAVRRVGEMRQRLSGALARLRPRFLREV